MNRAQLFTVFYAMDGTFYAVSAETFISMWDVA